MTKQNLIDALKTKFNLVGIEKQIGQEIAGVLTLTHWAIPVLDQVGNSLIRQWVHFYTDQNNNAFWEDREPKPIPPIPVESFIVKVTNFLQAKMTDGTIKYAFIDNISEFFKRAQISVVTPTNVQKKAIISMDTNNNFTIEII